MQAAFVRSRTTLPRLTRYQPSYETFPGWLRDTTKAKSFRDLPKQAREFLNFLDQSLDVPVAVISVGKDREKTILR